MRKITVFQTRGSKKVLIESDVRTFGQLQNLFDDYGVSYSTKEMVAVESIGNTSLELANAVLPDQDFTLGIFPRKTKAGSGRSELYNRIKEFVARDGKDVVNSYFKEATGKHYTNISTSDLETLVNQYGSTISVVTTDPKQDVASLLQELGVSSSLISQVTSELNEEKVEVNMEWIKQVCSQHPLTNC